MNSYSEEVSMTETGAMGVPRSIARETYINILIKGPQDDKRNKQVSESRN